jgi:D-alanine-D-alanine ligase
MKKKIAVLMGGPSSEYEISLASGENVLNNLPSKYEKIKILIDKKLFWHIENKKYTQKEAIKFLKEKNIDLVFIALHGKYGEDGKIQRILEKAKIKFTGSDEKASKIGIDKLKTYKILKKNKILFPKTWTLNEFIKKFNYNFSFPIVMKPNDQGSSVGVSILKNPDKKSFLKAVKIAKKFSKKILVQEYIKGIEVTCGVLGSKPLEPTLILPQKRDFFDYFSKYTPNATKEITPAPLEKNLIRKIKRTALLVHKVIGCRHFSRTDFILSGKNLYVLEINTIPGLTKTSLLPQQAKAKGINFENFLEKIIKLALK